MFSCHYVSVNHDQASASYLCTSHSYASAPASGTSSTRRCHAVGAAADDNCVVIILALGLALPCQIDFIDQWPDFSLLLYST